MDIITTMGILANNKGFLPTCVTARWPRHGQQEDWSVVPKRIVSERKRYNSSPNTCQLVSASKYGVVCPNSQHSSHACMWAMCNECKQTHRKIVSGVMKLVGWVPVNTNDQQQSLSRPKRCTAWRENGRWEYCRGCELTPADRLHGAGVNLAPFVCIGIFELQ
jgi:hypothetical protein